MSKRDDTFRNDLKELYKLWQSGEDVTPNDLLGKRQPRDAKKAAAQKSVSNDEQNRRRKMFYRLKRSCQIFGFGESWSVVISELQKTFPDIRDTSRFFAHAPDAMSKELATAEIRNWYQEGKKLSPYDLKDEKGERWLIYRRIQKAGLIYGELIEEVTGQDYSKIVRQSLSGAGRRGRLFLPKSHNVDKHGAHVKLRSFAETAVDDALCGAIGREKYASVHEHDVRYSQIAGLGEVEMRQRLSGNSPYKDGGKGPGISVDLVLWKGEEPYLIEVSPNANDPKYPDRVAKTEWKKRLAEVLGLKHVVIRSTNAKGVRTELRPVIEWFLGETKMQNTEIEQIVRSYELNLPYYKQGDDLAHAVQEAKGDPAKAFLLHAEALESAAATLRRMAGVAKEVADFAIEAADTHMIAVSGPEDKMAGLVSDGVLTEQLCPECDERDCACTDE